MKVQFQGRGGALDALRFFAAFGILLYHWGDNAPIPLDHFHPVFQRGFLATDFFLMLSGFVVTRSYGAALSRGALSTWDFVVKRLKRIWPGHAIVLAMMAGIVLLTALAGVAPQHPAHFLWGNLPIQLFLLHGWPGAAHEVWNYPTWTLSALLVCYALTPLMMRAGRSPMTGLLIAVAVVLAADAVSLAIAGQSLFELDIGVLRAPPLYLLGVALARLSESVTPPPLWAARTMGLAAGLALIGLQAFGPFDILSMATIAMVIFSAGVRPVARPRAIIEAGAKLSFAIFITHTLTATIWFGAIHHFLRITEVGDDVWWALWALSFPVALAAAYAFDRAIDQPVQRWIARQAPAARRAKIELGAG